MTFSGMGVVPTEKPPSSSPLVLSYAGDCPDEELLGWIRDGLVAGVVLFRDNAPDDETVRDAVVQLRTASPSVLTIMIDEEGGRVRRLADASESMASLRSYGENALGEVVDAYVAVAQRLRRLDIDTLLAPVLDIGGAESPWLNDRTFSNDHEQVAEFARQVIPAIQKTGIFACAKHFPGLRGVAIDPHTEQTIDATAPSEWDRIDAQPFRAAIAGDVGAVMVGHQVMMGFDPESPACLSPAIIGGLLRLRLGFTGLVLSDDLAMGAISKYFPMERAVPLAVRAGCNRVLVCQDRARQRESIDAWRSAMAHT